MRRKSLLFVLSAAVIFVTVFVAYTGGWGGVRATGGSLHVEGYGYGVGKANAAQISAHLTGDIVCVNNGTNTAPGQVAYSTDLPTKTAIFEGKNGKFFFQFDWTDAELGFSPSDWQTWGCPNSNWTVDYLHHFLTFTLKAVESDGTVNDKVTASFTCEMNPPALSGEYTCSQL